MSDDRPHTDPFSEEPWEDPQPLDDEEAFFSDDDMTAPWGDEEEADDSLRDLDESIYDPPEPPLGDAAFEDLDSDDEDGNGFMRNWRVAILILLAIVILALAVRALTGRKAKPTPEPLPTATLAPLPTFTPTSSNLTATTQPSQAMPPASSPLSSPPPSDASSAASETTPAPPPQDAIAIGQTVVVTGAGEERLSLRKKPTTKAARVRIIKDGVKLTVIDGPVQADGFTWWKVRTPKGYEGWAVEDYLAPQ